VINMNYEKKQEILKHHPELAVEVLDIYSLKIFLYLDLLLFSFFLGFLLYPLVESVVVTFLISLLFFIFFMIILELTYCYFPDSKGEK
jgi:hypothetical protein